MEYIMYQINPQQNTISSLKKTTFSVLKYKERQHLQEWIVKTPDVFGEELLIIQKEFDGFEDTRERLDLLALDKQGNVVIIENKLDDTWRDVVRQALKYAAYCSTLKKSDIVSLFQSYLDKYIPWKIAEKELTTFFETEDIDGMEMNQLQTQRVIFVAAKFRKEVTSTVLRLMDYGIRTQCFITSIYEQGEQHFLTMEQIIPIKDAEEYTISIAEKKQEEITIQTKISKRHQLCKEFRWQLLPEINKYIPLYHNVNPTTDHWLSAWSGVSWSPYAFVITDRKWYCNVELYPWYKWSKEANLQIFNALFQHKEEIEKTFWDVLIWNDNAWTKSTRISYVKNWVAYGNREDRPEIIDFLVKNMVKLYNSTQPYLQKIRE